MDANELADWLERGYPSKSDLDAAAELRRLKALEKDAMRYRWLRDMKPCSFTLSYNDDHATNYMTASDWIDHNPEWFSDTPPDDVQRMRDTNTIWGLQVYPNTPIGFNVWYAASLDAAIDAAMEAK